jgi:carboxyl-terminal processing protease
MLLWLAGCAAAPRVAPLTDEQVRLNVESFDHVWTTVRDKHFDPGLNGVDWQAARAELRPQVEQARDMRAARHAMSALIDKLNQTHFGIVSAEAYATVAADTNGAAGSAAGATASQPAGSGSAGLDLRVVDGQALVVRVEADSPAAQAGVRPGWVLVSAGGDDIPARLATLGEAMAEGAVGERVSATFLDETDQRREVELVLAPARGRSVRLGNMPAHQVWFESRRLEGGVGYITFNIFLDPGLIMGKFSAAMQEFKDAPGIVLDLRGNPGGIGAMAMGCAGWFVAERNRQLGVMKMRDNEVKFVIAPRGRPYPGPLAVLIDELSASTTEILAGGLRDVGRARLFGTRTAGAALPSNFERLPNGDGFQYAFADYVSAGGQRLEGIGVAPHEVVPWQRAALLAGKDPALEAALNWIRAAGGPALQ